MSETAELARSVKESTKMLQAIGAGDYEDAPEPLRRLKALMESDDPMVQVEAAGQLLSLGLRAAEIILDLAGVRRVIAEMDQTPGPERIGPTH